MKYERSEIIDVIDFPVTNHFVSSKNGRQTDWNFGVEANSIMYNGSLFSLFRIYTTTFVIDMNRSIIYIIIRCCQIHVKFWIID